MTNETALELLDRLENLLIAIDMRWDLDGVFELGHQAVLKARLEIENEHTSS